MSQLSIAIGNMLGGYGAGSLGAGESWIYNYGWTPYTYQNLNVYNEWDEVQGSDDIRYSANGEFYPQGLSYHRWITPEQPTNDCFLQFYCTNTWATAGDYMGVVVRGATGAKSGYSFHVGDEGRILSRWDDGVETVLDSDLTAPVTGDKYELRASGTTISVLKDDVELFSEVDATFSEGWFGLVSKGLDSNAEIERLLAGPYPKTGNAMWFQQLIGQGTNGVADAVVDGCMTSAGAITRANDASTSSTASHAAAFHDVGGTNMHWLEWDMLIPVYTTGIRMYDHLSYHSSRHWDDISVFGRNDSGDPWTTVAANIDISLPLTFGWLDPVSWTSPVTYRYYRVEVYSTIHGSQAGVNEVVFIGDVSADV